jgi:hypothetical protein
MALRVRVKISNLPHTRGTRSKNPFRAGVSESALCEGLASNPWDPLNSRFIGAQADSPSARRRSLRQTTLPPPDAGPIPRSGDGARKAGYTMLE